MSRKVELKVIITDVDASTGKLEGDVVPEPGSEPYKKPQGKNGLKFPKDHSYDITFCLPTTTPHQLHFPIATPANPSDSPSDAFWTGPMGVCPVQAPGNWSSDFEVKEKESTRDQLTVHNSNLTKGELMYMLRLRSSSSGEEGNWFWLDPVIENGGGGHGMFPDWATPVIVVLCVAAVAAVGYVLLT